ncbi:MAG: prolipoprotein diacylglyceryl transferase [Hespellia sp.]|nr:prolipoprotein diacylglyceryl transferase [Hespellia sp.]
MDMMIYFPHLGIQLEHVGKTISIFGFSIAYYGIIIGCGMLIAIFMAAHEAKVTGQNPENYFDLGIIGIICGVIGARIYFVIFSWDMYKDNLLDIFNTRQGGLAIYGGVIAAIITILVFAKVKHLSAPQIADVVAPSLLFGQIVGRWGNFFNREAFGEYTDGLFAMQLPLSAVRNSDVSETMRQHIETIDGVQFIQVQPTFLYESLWCLALLIIIFAYRRHKRFEGELILIYLFGYGLGRAWIEGLRTDQLWITGTQIAVSQVLAIVMVIVSGLLLFFIGRKQKKNVRSDFRKENMKNERGNAERF